MEGFDTGSKAASAKAAPTEDGMEKIAAVTVKIADSLGKSDWIPLLTTALELIVLVYKQMQIVAKSDPEIREVMKSSLERCNTKTLDLVNFLTGCKGNLQNIFAKFREAGDAAEKRPYDIEKIKKLIAKARGVQEGSQTTTSVTQDIDPSPPNPSFPILSEMEKAIKSTMEEYQNLLSESQLAIGNLSEKKAVTTSLLWKCVGVAGAALTLGACAMAYAVHPTTGSIVATAAGAAGVAKAAAAAGVAGAGLCISWAMDMQATIGHLERALSALKNINRTADNLERDLNGTKSSLHDLETAIQLAGERLDDLSRSSKKPQGLRANLVSFLRCVLVCCPGLLADDPESLNQVREKGRIVVQNSNSVNKELKNLELKINFLRQQVEDA